MFLAAAFVLGGLLVVSATSLLRTARGPRSAAPSAQLGRPADCVSDLKSEGGLVGIQAEFGLDLVDLPEKVRISNSSQQEDVVMIGKVVKMFYVDKRDPGKGHPVQIGRAILDVRHWQSVVEEDLLALYVFLRGHRVAKPESAEADVPRCGAEGLPKEAVVQMIAFLLDRPPRENMQDIWKNDDTIHDLSVFENVQLPFAKRKESLIRNSRQFQDLVSSRVKHWFGISGRGASYATAVLGELLAEGSTSDPGPPPAGQVHDDGFDLALDAMTDPYDLSLDIVEVVPMAEFESIFFDESGY
jgi:hypothetical protein